MIYLQAYLHLFECVNCKYSLFIDRKLYGAVWISIENYFNKQYRINKCGKRIYRLSEKGKLVSYECVYGDEMTDALCQLICDKTHSHQCNHTHHIYIYSIYKLHKYTNLSFVRVLITSRIFFSFFFWSLISSATKFGIFMLIYHLLHVNSVLFITRLFEGKGIHSYSHKHVRIYTYASSLGYRFDVGQKC